MAGWVYDTGPRYFDFLFGNEDSARQVLARWFARESSEFDGHWCRLLNVGSTAVGCAIVLPAAEVQQRRRTDTLELIKGCEAAERSSLLVKLGSLRGELETPLDGLYIRCFSLDRASRGLGYGRKFLQLLIDEAASAGVSRLCLDVEADNVPAVSLYESLGFRITSQSRLSALEMTVNAMTLVLAEE